MEAITLEDINIYDIGNEIQIVGTIWSGKGLAFITQFPGKNEDFSVLKKLQMDLSDWERFLRQTDICETEIFQSGPTGVVKSIVRKTARQIDSYMQWEVFQRDNYACRYCGRTGVPLTVDHIDLWENGGATVAANLISACRNCNKNRGRTEYDQWIESTYYKQRSNSLSEIVRQENLAIVNQLPHLKTLRMHNVRSR